MQKSGAELSNLQGAYCRRALFSTPQQSLGPGRLRVV